MPAQYFGASRATSLQNSVWITPDPLTEERQILGGGKINVESLLLLEARPCAGESDAEIVAGAWDFERINRRYARHLKILGERPGSALRNDATAKALQRWAATEREAWLEAVTNDPLLPGRILPSDYLGQQAWRRRVEVLQPSLKLRLGQPDACRAEAKRRRTHVQTRIARCKLLLHMQQQSVVSAGGNGWDAAASRLADGKGLKARKIIAQGKASLRATPWVNRPQISKP